MPRPRSERRQQERFRLSSPVVARLGLVGVVVIDVSAKGARVEHYVRCKVGEERPLRLESNEGELSCRTRVVSCRVHRFASGDHGLTVYHSGLLFLDDNPEFVDEVRHLIAAQRATALVEQVANARGFQPPKVDEMPIFREGGLTSNRVEIQTSKKLEHLLPDSDIVTDQGFVRCRYRRGSWEKKWTLDRTQPEDGFTVSAGEAEDQIDMLCSTYASADDEHRKLIRAIAAAAVGGDVASDDHELPHDSVSEVQATEQAKTYRFDFFRLRRVR